MGESRCEGVDAYIAAVPSESARASLSFLRSVILDAVPGIEEVIKYGIPTYQSNGFVASIAAYKNHCSFFPGHTVVDFAEELKGYRLAKGTVHVIGGVTHRISSRRSFARFVASAA